MVTEIKLFTQARVRNDDENLAQRREFPEFNVKPGNDLGSGIPDDFLLGTLNDARLRVSSPIKVIVTKEGDKIIIEAVELSEFGFGDNFSEAVKDLQHAIVELYFTLEREQNRLGGDLPDIWTKLQNKLIKR